MTFDRLRRAARLAPLAALLLWSAPSPARSQDASPSKEGGMGGMSPQDMQKMMEMATPGPHHKELDRLVGTWKTSVKMFMGPGGPTVSTGSATFSWILGGRYLQSRQTGEIGGMAFEGMGIDGYDNAKKEFFNVWIDNMGTGVMKLSGQPTADGKGIDYAGVMYDPVAGKDVPVREEMRWTGDRAYVFSMYAPMPAPDGKPGEMKVMEITGEKM